MSGLDVVVWGPYGEDWIESTPEEVADRALRNLHPGDILLMHDGLERPAGEPIPALDRVRAVSLILDGLDRMGLRPITVGDLIETGGARRTAWFRP
jgi:peptidoglycan/xylan/chitin deacetylase (PgdA/CDA1 family)